MQREIIHVKIKAGGSRKELAKLFKKVAKFELKKEITGNIVKDLLRGAKRCS